MPLGLSQAEAKQRFAQFGPNEPSSARRTAPLVQLLTLLTNPLAIILMVASVISAALGEVINASIIITMVLLSVALNTAHKLMRRAATRGDAPHFVRLALGLHIPRLWRTH